MTDRTDFARRTAEVFIVRENFRETLERGLGLEPLRAASQKVLDLCSTSPEGFERLHFLLGTFQMTVLQIIMTLGGDEAALEYVEGSPDDELDALATIVAMVDDLYRHATETGLYDLLPQDEAELAEFDQLVKDEYRALLPEDPQKPLTVDDIVG